jgi:gluconate 2-dehydrogenase alpha chain
MGADPKSSVVNRYLQAWNAHNLFVQGASVFPQQPGYNPTGTLGAVADWAANAVTQKYRDYIRNPQGKVKGNRMPYGGMSDPNDVDDVIGYLKTLK